MPDSDPPFGADDLTPDPTVPSVEDQEALALAVQLRHAAGDRTRQKAILRSAGLPIGTASELERRVADILRHADEVIDRYGLQDFEQQLRKLVAKPPVPRRRKRWW